jgi:hypothetical protein
MSWTADPAKHEAMNEHGYVLRWAHNKHGTWFNAYSPNGTHVDASYDKDKMQAACDAHRVMLENQRAMRVAEKAAKTIHVEPSL